MCNDYGLNAPLSLINQRFGQVDRPLMFPEGAPNLGPRNDIWPTETAPVVRAAEGGGVELLQLRWGFAPARPSSPTGSTRRAPPVINFRSEGRRFGNTATGGRCLIPASHFYEFTAPDPVGSKRALKSKWEFTPADQPNPADRLFCIAGLWRAANEAAPASYTMLTCAPGPDIAPIHDRQIVVLTPEHWTAWLAAEPDAAGALLGPSPVATWSVRQVR